MQICLSHELVGSFQAGWRRGCACSEEVGTMRLRRVLSLEPRQYAGDAPLAWSRGNVLGTRPQVVTGASVPARWRVSELSVSALATREQTLPGHVRQCLRGRGRCLCVFVCVCVCDDHLLCVCDDHLCTAMLRLAVVLLGDCGSQNRPGRRFLSLPSGSPSGRLGALKPPDFGAHYPLLM